MNATIEAAIKKITGKFPNDTMVGTRLLYVLQDQIKSDAAKKKMNEIILEMADKNFKVLGNGLFSYAFGDGVTAFKICVDPTDGYPWYADWCIHNFGESPHIPLIQRFDYFHDEFYWTEIEQMEKLAHHLKEFPEQNTLDARAAAQRWISKNSPHYGSSEFAKFCNKIVNLFGDIANVDIHSGNVMVRDGNEFVLNDPLSRLYDPLIRYEGDWSRS